MRARSSGPIRVLFVCLLTAMTIAVSSCRGGDHAVSTATAPTTADSNTFGVGLYGVDAKTFRSIPLPHPVSQARWLSDGDSFVAFDTQSRTSEIFDLQGNNKGKISSDQNDAVHTSHHGSIIIEHRRSKSFASFDPATLKESAFSALPGDDSDAVFSPDGTRVVYVNKDSSRKALVIATANGSDPKILVSETNADRDIGVGDASWSPDGQWLLIRISACPRGSDPQCHIETSSGYEVIDLSGHVVWTKESATIFLTRWAGPARLLAERPDATPDVGQFGTRQAFISIPDGTQTLAPDIVHPTSELSPDGHLILDRQNGNGLYACVLTDIETSAHLIDGACGIEDWTSDGKQVLVWDTICSVPTLKSPSDRCVDGRLQPPVAKPTPTADLTGHNAYTPGPSCDVTAASSRPVTPAASTPNPDDHAPTPQYYAALKRFVESRFKVTYRACVPKQTGNHEQTITWYKDGTARNRFDVHDVVRGEREFDLTYLEDGDRLIVCGQDLGRYLDFSFPSRQDAPGPLQQFYQAVQPLTQYNNACLEDDHHLLLFDAPFEGFSNQNNPLSFPGGVTDPRKINVAKLDVSEVATFGSFATRGTRTIAGQTATCFGNGLSEFCFGTDGVLLFAAGSGSVEADAVSTNVQPSDFDAQFEVKAEIPRCFPQAAIATEPAGSVSTAVSKHDFNSAVKVAALGLNDLPCDWSSASTGSGNGSDCRFCCDARPIHDSDGTFETEGEFQVSRGLGQTTYVEDLLAQQVTYDPRGRVSDFIKSIEAYWRGCPDHTFLDSNGDQITMHSRRLEGVTYGDQSDVYLLTFNHNAYGDYVLTYIRRGNVMTLLIYYDGALGIRDPDRSRAVRAAKLIADHADSKLAELSSSLP